MAQDLKLIRYKILFVKRGHEAVLAEGEELITEPMVSHEFVARKTDEFLKLRPAFPDEDRNYLRLSYEVLARF